MHFAALYVVFGGATFWLLAAPSAMVATGGARPLAATVRLLRLAAPFAALSGIAWLAGTIAFATGGLASLGDPAMLRVFFLETPFGPPAALRLALLASLLPIACLALAPRTRLASCAVVGAALLVSQAWLGHADEGGATMLGAAMIVSYAVHVLATAAWVGGLPPLAFVVAAARRRNGSADARFDDLLRRYSDQATLLVVLLLGSGTANTWFHGGGSLAALAATAYGAIVLTKVALVAAMLLFAGLNRLVLMPRLRIGADRPGTLRRLRASVACETALACLVLGAAAVLGITPPPQ